ncbi:PspC domain-containing protein [Kitasatospora sp. NPDC058965]|uniref:PspC domain-containing protein n=1 Tax=Kitasatospora sp. NPDC058965 TaxID=3346682 RepID=UPI0036A07C42
MTEEQSQTPAGPADERPEPDPQPSGARPPLTRSESHRVVAGVCGGLGRHLDIDPVVFRVVTAVLCLTGGLGLFVYGLAWLIMPTERPEQGHGRTELQRVLTGRVDGQSIGAVLLTVIGTGVFFSWMGSGDSFFPLLLLGAMVFFAVRHDPERRRRARGAGTPPRPEGPYDRPAAGPGGASPLADWKTWREDFHAEWTARKADMHQHLAEHRAQWDEQRHGRAHQGYRWDARTATADAGERPPADSPAGRTGYLWDPRHPERNPYDTAPPPGAPAPAWWQRTDLPEGDPLRKEPAPPRPTPPPARRERRQRSGLAWLGLLVAALASWAVWAGTAHGAGHSPLATVLATGLTVLGLTLLIGAKFGRAKWLVLPALVVTLALAGLGNSATVRENAFGDRRYAPADAAAVQHTYVLGAGDLRLDLSAVDPAGGTVSSVVKLGAGDVHVVLPPDVAADLDLRTAAGRLQAPQLPDDSGAKGVGEHRTVHLDPVPGSTGRGTIELTVQVGLGDIQVVRG